MTAPKARFIKGQRLAPIAFRAGGGLIALLQDKPLSTSQFMWDVPAYPAHTTNMRGAGGNPSLGIPSDIVHVTAEGVAWFLDAERGRIVSQNVGGARVVIAKVSAGLDVRRACTLTDSLLVVLRDGDRGGLYVYDLARAVILQRHELPQRLTGTDAPAWSSVRISGSRGGPCVAFSPITGGVAVVTDEGVREVATVTQSTGGDAKPRRATWWRASRREHGPVDATSYPGGVAVLNAGTGESAGRIVDFYSVRGAYHRSVTLPRRALRIAGALNRFYVLSQFSDSAVLASYALPPYVRRMHPSIPPDVIVPQPRGYLEAR